MLKQLGVFVLMAAILASVVAGGTLWMVTGNAWWSLLLLPIVLLLSKRTRDPNR